MAVPIVRESDVKANPSTIWHACFVHMKFEKWDPDVEVVTDVRGNGCENGTKFTFVMKDGPIKRIPCVLSDVKVNESLRFTGAAVWNLIQFDGLIEISTKNGSNKNFSHIKYSFNMTGPLGTAIMHLNPKAAIQGTEGGLQNMVNLSEEKEEAGSQ
jgi:hypothetical protein